MGNINERIRIRSESKERMTAINFGDEVTNICAGNENPHKFAYFVAYIVTSRKNKFGITQTEYLAKCTDKQGKFWMTCIDVIYPGHLDEEMSKKLFDPVWKAQNSRNCNP